MTEQQRDTQYQAKMTQLNAERTDRNQPPLETNAQETRDNWYASHVATDGRLFPFSDNLTTLMLIIGSDRNEAQKRKTYKLSFSPQHYSHCVHQ